MAVKKKIKFIMETDWLFKEPIDFEHKEYTLLGYFQKMGKKLDNMELYPGFIEIALHLANIKTLISDKRLVYTNKKFESIDDELLVSDLKLKSIPEMGQEELKEFTKILKFSAPRITEYFNIAKSIWTIVYDRIEVKPKINKKNMNSNVGHFYYKTNTCLHVWSYSKVQTKVKGELIEKMVINKIYDEKIDNTLTIKDIINRFSEVPYGKNPVIEMKCEQEFPIDETLLPLFKRKFNTLIIQSITTDEK